MFQPHLDAEANTSSGTGRGASRLIPLRGRRRSRRRPGPEIPEPRPMAGVGARPRGGPARGGRGGLGPERAGPRPDPRLSPPAGPRGRPPPPPADLGRPTGPGAGRASVWPAGGDGPGETEGGKGRGGLEVARLAGARAAPPGLSAARFPDPPLRPSSPRAHRPPGSGPSGHRHLRVRRLRPPPATGRPGYRSPDAFPPPRRLGGEGAAVGREVSSPASSLRGAEGGRAPGRQGLFSNLSVRLRPTVGPAPLQGERGLSERIGGQPFAGRGRLVRVSRDS